MFRTMLIAGMSFLAVACTAPLSPEVREKLDLNLAFATVQADPDRYLGQSLLLGGSVVALHSNSEESYLEVQRWELNRWGEPLDLADAGDRFLVRSPKLLDSDRYTPGRLVTLGGTVSGTVNAGNEDHDERILLFELLDIYLWDTPFRYGLHPNSGPGQPEYIAPQHPGPAQPYDPTPWAYPYSPHWYRNQQ
jgi:outer membrane lipoprotein